jgi:hypothetical protein
VVVVTPPVSSSPPVTVVVAPPASPGTSAPLASGPLATETPGQPKGADRARFYPGPDESQGTPRVRAKTAVLLFAAPPERVGEDVTENGLGSVRRLSFEPVACVIAGKLAAGLRCAEAMPPRATVRTTAGVSLEVVRRTAPFHDTAGNHTYPAPYAPSCCMYNTCTGKTIPYLPSADVSSSMSATYATRTVLAVWPENADIGLVSETADAFDATKQAVWSAAATSPGAREYLPIATTDLDGDKRREVLVYERWANDYGLFVVPFEGARPLFRLSCGNI